MPLFLLMTLCSWSLQVPGPTGKFSHESGWPVTSQCCTALWWSWDFQISSVLYCDEAEIFRSVQCCTVMKLRFSDQLSVALWWSWDFQINSVLHCDEAEIFRSVQCCIVMRLRFSDKYSSKTHKRLREHFLIRQNRTKHANFQGKPLFQATYNNIQQKTVKPTYLVSVWC